jgi:hypothetical protein
MHRHANPLAIVLAFWFVAGLGRLAIAQEEIQGYFPAAAADQAQRGAPSEYGPPPNAAPETDPSPPPIPPNAEGAAYSVPGGGYCYFGPHPVDTRVSAGEPWDDTPGAHMHAYPPLDLRLFEFRDGCYYFVGDPRDFGYAGQTYSYYGAHPILDVYGGGWCFMIGPHTHLWRPWSPHFTLVGPWYYWEGPYDPFFWSYWPYYSFYYRSYYPMVWRRPSTACHHRRMSSDHRGLVPRAGAPRRRSILQMAGAARRPCRGQTHRPPPRTDPQCRLRRLPCIDPRRRPRQPLRIDPQPRLRRPSDPSVAASRAVAAAVDVSAAVLASRSPG